MYYGKSMIKTMGRRVFLILVAGVIAGTVAAPASFAQGNDAADTTQESIVLSPVNKKYSVDAGKTLQDSLTIINDGKVAYDFLVYARPYTVSDELYNPDFTKISDNTDIYQWVQFSQTKYRLEAGASVTVPYSVRVPQNAKPGGYYGVIFAETQPSGEVTGNAVVRKKRVGSIVYATVNGNTQLAGEHLETIVPFWQLQPPLTVTSRVKNTGNTDFADTVRLTVKDVFGNTKFDTTKEFQILPQTTRKMTLKWDDATWFGLYNVSTTQKFLDKTHAQSNYVLIVPRYVIVVVLGLMVVGGGYAWYRRKKH